MRICSNTSFQTQLGKGTHSGISEVHTLVVPSKKAHICAHFSYVRIQLPFMLQLTTVIFLIAFGSLSAIHTLATHFSLYWYFWWFDIPMHLFGGIVLSLGFFTLRDLHLLQNKHLSFGKCMFLVLCIALAWELFEHSIGVPIEADFMIDTVTDLVMGLTGGALGYFIGNSVRNLR